ncbi:MAG: type II toxin-antitoxin system HicB family antitoxin [Methanomicrobiales archaeon]
MLIHKAEVQALSGCVSQGETVEETITNTKDAIELHIACLMEDNELVPVDDEFIISRVSIETVTV